MRISLKWSNALVAFCLALSLLSCQDLKSDYDKQAAIDDTQIEKYLTQNNIQAAKHYSGFYYQVVTPNETGATLSGNDVVDFKYKLSLLDGTVIEDSLAAKKPARVKLLDYSIVPEALDRGIALMKVGSTYRFYIPSNLAFGDYRSSKFPSQAIMIADIRVTAKHTEDEVEQTQLDSIDTYVKAKYGSNFEKFASGLYMVNTVTGTGDKPHLGDRVTVNMTRRYLDGTVIKSFTGVKLDLGYQQAVQGLEEGLLQMHAGGKAILVMPSSIAFKQSLCLLPQKIRSELLEDQLITSEVLPYSIVEYEVELKSVNL
jgi:FKBP-type peptidyl-prolyl cis-trans isomerase